MNFKRVVLKILVMSLLFSSSLFAKGEQITQKTGELSETQVSMLYVALFNRASEGEGNRYWQGTGLSMEEMAGSMLSTTDAQNYFGNSLDTNRAFVEHIYRNTLNKAPSDDPDGIAYWVNLLNSGVSRGTMVSSFVTAATDPANAGNAQNQFNNRVTVSNYMSQNVEATPSDYATSTSFGFDLTVTSDGNSVNIAMDYIITYVKDPSENYSPKVDAGEDKTTEVNQAISITGTATDSDGSIVGYEWREGTDILATTATLSYIATTEGEHTLTFRATDNNGSSVSDSMVVTVAGEINIGICDSGYSLIYSFSVSHTSGSISSSSNKVYVIEMCKKEDDIKVINRYTLGSFTNKPNDYEMYYSSDNKPPYGYTRYDYYNDTKYHGLQESKMYASDTKEDFILKVQSDISTNQCKRYSSNYSNGNLNNNDNFWTYFCPKEDLLTTLSTLLNVNSKAQKTITGTVKNDNGTAVSGINVKFEYLINGEEKSTTAVTDALGNYSIKVDKENFKNSSDVTYLIYAYKEGYVPSTKTLKMTDSDSYSLDFVINPIKVNEVVLEIEPKVHHLGDDSYSGSVNSQFQKKTEGTSFNKSFNISLTQYSNYGKATLKFEAKGIQTGGKLVINSESYNLSSSPSNGSYMTYNIELEKSNYKQGSNSLQVISKSSGSDYDDFEFSNIVLEFSGDNIDSDGDGISDEREIELGLNPNSTDSDGDGILDKVEIGDIDNPTDTDGDGIIDALDLDSDGDGYSDSEEIIAGTSPINKDDYPNSVGVNLTNGLVAHYEFEGNANDSSENGDHGTEHGGVGYTDGVIGKAGSFDGIDDYIVSNILNNSDNFTISLFFKIDSLENRWNNLIGFEGSFNALDHFLFYFKENSYLFIERDNDGGKVVTYNNLNDDKFHHLLIKNDSELKIYIDDKLEQTLPKFNLKVSEFRIGAEYSSNNSKIDYFYNGKIDDLRIYNRALNETEIQALYELGDTTSTVNSSSITGKVQDAINSNPIVNANIKLYQNGLYISVVETDSSGIYTIPNLAGESGYSIEISKTDYLTVNYQNIELEANVVKHLETVMHIEQAYAGDGDASGQITNSVDGRGVSGLLINFRKGINVHSGTIVRTETTGNNGLYSVSSLEAGSYTAELTGSGYQKSYITVVVLGGKTNDNQNGTINPILEEGEIRIVLTWGENPSDLDSHLTGPLEGSSDRFHVYWWKDGNINSSPYTNLDVDDTSSYGPETITIRTQQSGVYRYSIHDYSNKSRTSSSALANSGAKIKVYKGSGLVAEYFVPNEAGTLWRVFEIDGGSIKPINSMSYHQNEDTVE